MHTTQHIRIAVTIAFAVALAGAPSTAQARQEPGPALPSQVSQVSQVSRGCSLQRVDTQFVACDDLTGNDVPAPSWIPQR